MKKIFSIIIIFLISFSMNSQSLIGAWERVQKNDNGVLQKEIVIFTTQGYQSISIFNAKTGEFIYTNGGTWELNGENLTEKVEFDTTNPERVGSETTFKIIIDENSISIPSMQGTWNRFDNGSEGKLEGAWLMGGRYRNGKKQMRSIDGPRKTMKLLSGKRFQWIAYNTATKQFMGTGGGTYTTENGIYSENVEFFSRDNSKAGIKLKFDYELINDEWNHKGFSSKGDPLHEIWVKRND